MAALSLVRATYEAWNADHAQRLAAALAYYITFALAPFLIVVVQIVGLILGHGHDARGQILAIVSQSAGPSAAQALGSIVDGIVSQQGTSVLTAIVSWIVLVLSAGGLFGAIQDALNAIFNIEQPKGGIWLMVRERFVSFAMVGGIALLLIVSLLVNAIITSLANGFERVIPGLVIVFQVAGVLFTFGLTMLLVAVIYKWLPDHALHWRDVIPGAFVTALLFGVGELALGWYLGRAGWTSAYGAAGSLVLILLWVYYSAQIFLVGAEFTKAFAARRHHAAQVDPRRAA